MSVHATGRAVDFSYRNMGKGKGVSNGRREAVRMCKLLVTNADLLGLEALFDYFPAPHGRAWMCDRDAWSNYKKETIHGAPKETGSMRKFRQRWLIVLLKCGRLLRS